MSPNEQAAPPVKVQKGLEGVVAGETAISDVDGQRCQLVYRGYHIDELVGKTSDEEVAYLLLNGTLPTRSQLADWTQQLESARALDPQLVALLQALPAKAGPMALLRTAVSALGLYDATEEDVSVDVLRRKAVRVIAKIPTMVAAIGRLRDGAPLIAPKAGLGQAANFLWMLLGAEPTVQQANALDAYFILLADHGFNVSTFTARTVTGT